MNLLTFDDMVLRLRCSKSQVSKLIRGKVRGVPKLRIVRFGRRVLAREDVFDEWIVEVEEQTCNTGH